MPLPVGTRLGPYEILLPLGSGGMGEVYRARDTKLKRDVALKILPSEFTHDPERIARFRREAQVLAAVNHPHIGAIYGLDEANGQQFLVLELVDGESLDRRIARGPIPVDEALGIARQIAEGLEVAHEKGIIHRDLKPANIALATDGNVKVLDFGLAKATEPASGPSLDVTNSPTITSPAMMTGIGMILGTAAYMSPEQAKGRVADKRSDVWAYGCVLYEMLTGSRAFTGNDVSDVLARVLEREPDFNALPGMTPPAIRRLLRRSLEKDRKRRLPDIGVAVLEIDEALATPGDSPVGPSARRTGMDWRAALGGALLAAAVVATAMIVYVRRTAVEPMVSRLEISTPGTIWPFQFALSPDGRRVAFITGGTGPQQLAVRSLDQGGVQILAGTEGASNPFWAPDSRTVGFFAASKLQRIDLSGGAPQILTDAMGATPRGATWSDQGVIVFSTANSGLMRVPATGGTPVEVTRLAGQGGHQWPQFLPDGRHVLFLVAGGQPQTHGVYVASLDGGEPMRILGVEQNAMYAPPGYLLRASQGVLVAQHFDAARLTVSGDPFPVAQGIGQDDGTGRSAFSVSAAGILAHRLAAVIPRQLVWVDRTGKSLGTVGPLDEGNPTSPALAPDEKRVAHGRSIQNNTDIWLTDIGRAIATRFTVDPALDVSPVWSPDGTDVVFRSTRKGPSDLFIKPANGATDEQPLLVNQQNKTPLDWSRDGRFLLFSMLDAKTQSDLWVLPMGPSHGSTNARKPFPIVQTSFDETQGQFSPDGRWIAYTSNESGRDEIYVRPFSDAGGKWQVSTGGGSQPRWRGDGNEIFYVAADAHLMAVPIRATSEGRAIDAGKPLVLFPTHLANGSGISLTGWQSRALYAVTRDGRFLMNVNADAATPDIPPLTVVLNWTAGVKK
ncbi:MAG TPA: protein kinase [Vicinamibacterales bacterium]|nr:protein kinase [Vicinamibacterales bacterium]